MSRVYAWDSMEVILGEGTMSFVKPPDYVTLLSNLFYARKAACKEILKTYVTGTPYALDIPETVPEGIAARIRSGEMERADLEAYYNSTVKGMFNAIYGMEGQDVFKPGYKVEDGEISVDRSTVVSRETYAEHYEDAKRKLVLYPYGLRIVGGSRMALVAAIESIDRVLGDSEKGGNARTVAYMRERYGREVDTAERVIDYDGERASYTYLDDEGNEVEW